ncbi:MAG: FAD-dependent oxidoreductase [Burkholderiaceae bacterium]|nr:MAG: FAD-dependent oxidoreductase [Burkholderiaceae bacterium]
MNVSRQLLIAGGGIGGLAAALALSSAGWQTHVFERVAELSEVGAGLQLGPNATRLLLSWGLESDLRRVAAVPERIVARSALSGAELATLPLGASIEARYGAPYFTVHRAELHRLLCAAVLARSGVRLDLSQAVHGYSENADGVTVTTDSSGVAGAALIGADGLHSAVRVQMLGGGAPRGVGDVAYRTLLKTADLPLAARVNQVTVWLGPDLHVVQYPVRCGEAINLVVLVHGAHHAAQGGWDHAAEPDQVERALYATCRPLRDLVAAARHASLNERPWGMWVLADRPPVSVAGEMARGRVALAGDAAHPMRPYLAQGAGMAIEDAAALAAALADESTDIPTRLQRYAESRWRRCARVQARSERNSTIFHARGLMRLGRDVSLRLMGERLMDVPWLYGRR